MVPPPPPVIEIPVEKPFTSYFKQNVDVTYKETISRLEGVDGTEYSFDKLLLRQIDMLSQDLIHRLTSIYGMGSSGNNNTVGRFTESAHAIKDILNSNNNYLDKNSNSAIISDYNLIKSPYSATSTTAQYKYNNGYNVNLTSTDIGESASYAQTLQSGTWNDQTVIGKQYNFQNAINGGFTYNNGFTQNLNTGVSWNYSNSTALKNSDSVLDSHLVYEDFKRLYHNKISIEIANILANKSLLVTGETDLDKVILKIDHLGFSVADKLNITNYVLHNVIGLVNLDNSMKYPSQTIT